MNWNCFNEFLKTRYTPFFSIPPSNCSSQAHWYWFVYYQENFELLFETSSMFLLLLYLFYLQVLYLGHWSNLEPSKNSRPLFEFWHKTKLGRNTPKSSSLLMALPNCLTRPNFMCKGGIRIFSESTKSGVLKIFEPRFFMQVFMIRANHIIKYNTKNKTVISL